MTALRKNDVVSPMVRGNGAYVIHRVLERHLPELSVDAMNPYMSLFPPAFRQRKIDQRARIIHTTPDYAVFFKRKTSKLVITFHNYVLDPWMRKYSSIAQSIHYSGDLRFFTGLALKRADAITAVSRFTARLVKDDTGTERPVRVVYNGVDSNIFYPSSASSPKKIKVFFSGNLTMRKGAQWLPGIAKRLGRGVEIYYTLGLRNKKRLPELENLKCLGPVPYRNMPGRYRQMDILIFPSVREGFGMAALEAMACGLPVVASDCSALPELIEDQKGGFLCPVGDVDAFAEKINLLASSPGLRREMGDFNRHRAETSFTVEKMVEGYRQVYRDALA